MPLGFVGYKVGMLHVTMVGEVEGAPTFGKPVFTPATVISTPPMIVCGIRFYEKENEKLRSVGEVRAVNLKEFGEALPADVKRSALAQLDEFSERLDTIERISLIVGSSPRDAGLSQKRPFLVEIPIGGGDIKSKFEYAKSVLGERLSIFNILKPGQYLDVIGVTKGKGFEGPVTRFGVKRKQHKSRKSVRAVGTLGPIRPASVMYTVPRAGQMGFHRRTQHNLRVILMDNAKKSQITPPSGFHKFGLVKSDYILLKGSVQGPPKRPLMLRYAVRARGEKIIAPRILEISLPVKVKGLP